MASRFKKTALDQKLISDTSAKIGEALDRAPFDPTAWENLATHFIEAFPEGRVAFQSIDPVRSEFNLELVEGFDPDYMSSYRERYCRINPWGDFLAKVTPGSVIVSERDHPAHLFRETEFYNDWLLPQKSVEAASAVMFKATPRDLVVIALHYPVSMNENVGRASEEIFKRIRGSLKRSVETTRRFENILSHERSAAALIGRSDDVAFVIDSTKRISEMNSAAEAQFRLRRLVALRANQVSILAPDIDIWLANTLHQLSRGIPMDTTSRIFRCHDDLYQIDTILLPKSTRFGASPFSRPLFLVTLRLLSSGGSSGKSIALLGPALGLTAAEIRLCDALAQNHSLKDAGDILGLTIETVRHRLKIIFHKTGTHRQSALMALLKRLL